MDEPGTDQEQAALEAAARGHLLDAGASSLPRPPWLRGSQPPSAADLIRFALWRAGDRDAGKDGLLAALSLLPAARAELDQAEAAVLWMARSAGLSWPQISRAMGLASAQAAQQRFGRVSGRVENHGSA
ncbi:MAG: DNA-binding protein [Streptosporangiaceae bacterium]